MSRTGVLFLTDSDLAPRTVLMMCILFPAEITGEAPASVFCWGTVVRRASFDPPEGRTAIAATIVHYRFSRVKKAAGIAPRAFANERMGAGSPI